MENSLRVEVVEQEAAEWLLRRDSAQWSTEDDAKLREWLQASLNHRVAFMRLSSVWKETARLKSVAAGLSVGQVPSVGAMEQSCFFVSKRREVPAENSIGGESRAGFIKLKWLAAAGIVLAITAGIAAYVEGPRSPEYRTPVGGLANFPLDDGSKITLNTNSQITLALTEKERRVNLEQGEAFFDVAKDPVRPFVVYANDQRVVAVGTRFSVRLKPESVQVAVTEGRVRLEKQPSLLLTPGMVVEAKDRRVSVLQQPLAQVEQQLSWRAGYVVLRKAALGEAVAEFNRYNRRQLVIEDAQLAEIRVGGNFQSSNIDGFVRLLQEGFGVRAEQRDDRIILKRRL
jgi:transmembrane sensor